MEHYTRWSFWGAALDRAIRTFAQALVAFITADVVGILDVDWVAGFGVAGLAAALSILTSIGTPETVDPGTYQARYRAED